ncbi:hypothetical protein HHK36_016519 [Tetracentron sinense]|uniref:FAR1 domain-containing protein n=1 Tax=Tetracentron sinense TaxID=13715 RepID=A0A834YXD2_TETSI|nr:hypothetical protein HHK36_016519 [Tetracentron sinense]
MISAVGWVRSGERGANNKEEAQMEDQEELEGGESNERLNYQEELEGGETLKCFVDAYINMLKCALRMVEVFDVESSFEREPCCGFEDADMTVISDERMPNSYELDGSVEPYIGMKFESEEAAMKYYDAYSKCVGFIIRINYCQRSKCDKSVVSRTFVCNEEGFLQEDYRRRPIVRYPRPPSRVGCKATLVVRKDKTGIWVVTKLETKHSHPLGYLLARVVKIRFSLNRFNFGMRRIREFGSYL